MLMVGHKTAELYAFRNLLIERMHILRFELKAYFGLSIADRARLRALDRVLMQKVRLIPWQKQEGDDGLKKGCSGGLFYCLTNLSETA